MSYNIQTNVPTNSVTAVSISALGIDKNQLQPWRTNPGDYAFGNVQSPIGLPMIVNQKWRRIGNIYGTRTASRGQNVVVPSVQQLPKRSGIELHLHLEESWTISDSTDPTAPQYVAPASASITLRFPENQLVTETQLNELVQRLLGLLYNVNGGSKIMELARGYLDLR